MGNHSATLPRAKMAFPNPQPGNEGLKKTGHLPQNRFSLCGAYLMIHGVHLLNFGNHRDSRLEFGSITALVGRNGSGKTTVLRAIRELARIAAPSPVRFAGELFHQGSKQLGVGSQELLLENVRTGENLVGLSTSGEGRPGTWGLSIEGEVDPNRSDARVPVKLEWTWLSETRPGETYLPALGPAKFPTAAERATLFAGLKKSLSEEKSDSPVAGVAGSTMAVATPVNQPKAEWLPQVLDCQYLHGVGINLHRPSYTSEIPPRLTGGGENLPSVIAYLMTFQPERFEALLDAFRRLVPIVSRIRVRPATVSKRETTIVSVNRKEMVSEAPKDYSGHELIFDLRSGKGVPATVVSEGTLLILALLTIFHTSDAPQLVLIDDVEQALHPWAQRELVQHFRALQKERPTLQLILTTHSPYIIDELDPSEVWMLAENPIGFAIAKRLSSHPDLPRAKGILTTGEFWSSDGEAWLFKDS